MLRGVVQRPVLEERRDDLQGQGRLSTTDDDGSLRARELHYRTLYENAPLAYIAYDASRRIQNTNPACVELSGFSDAELRGQSYLAFAPGPEWEAVYRDAFDLAERGRDEVFDVQTRHRDGSVRWIRATVRAVRDGNGRVVGFCTLAADIAEMKAAEQSLRESEARLSAIIESAQDAIVTFDDEGLIRLFNPAAEKILRVAAADAIGTPVARFTTPGSAADLTQALDDVRAGRRRFAVNAPGLTARRADGDEFEYDATMSCQEVGGRRLYTLAVRDLAERRRIEAEQHRLELQTAYLQDEIKAVHNFEEIVGHSRAFIDVLAQVELVAPTDSSVLIFGETGAGKELIARAVHSRSRRHDRPLIKVNCAALPAGLVESELFGHERGAFTGAAERRIGRFELAHRGTLFLDEIGELPPEAQVKLLRVLQEQEFERIGGRETITVEVRVIAATNRDLARMVAEGGFRQDLYYRLNVFPVRIPPLRERREDIPLLVRYFVDRYAAKIGRRIERVAPTALARLLDYPWPGNVRELENVIERAVILSPGPILDVGAGALPAPVPVASAPPVVARTRGGGGVAAGDSSSLHDVERQHIVAVLQRTRWRIDGPNGAARILNLRPSTLRSRMQKLGIRRSAEDRA